MWDLSDLQRAFLQAQKMTAERKSKELAEEGVASDHFSIRNKGRIYKLEIPAITLKSRYGVKEEYVRRDDFLQTFAPVVGAAVMFKFNKEYGKKEKENEHKSEAEKSLLHSYRRMNFFEKEQLGHSYGKTLIGSGGIRCGFQVEWKQSEVFEQNVSGRAEQGKLFSFAKGYLHAMEKSSPHPQIDGYDYMEISSIPHLKTSMKVLARIAHDISTNDRIPIHEKHFWQVATRHVADTGLMPQENNTNKKTDSRPVYKRICDIFKPK